jgi:hypothetical protein
LYKFGHPKKIEKIIVFLKRSTWMYIKYVINQYHGDRIKDYPHVDHEIQKHFHFQYIQLVYG